MVSRQPGRAARPISTRLKISSFKWRFILKAPRHYPATHHAQRYTETMNGFQYLPIQDHEDGHRAKFFARVNNLEPHRWPKFLLNTMISLDVQSSKIKIKFLYHFHNVLDKCSVSNIIDCAKTGRSPD